MGLAVGLEADEGIYGAIQEVAVVADDDEATGELVEKLLQHG